MSTFLTEVTTIENLVPHPGANALELAQIKGWQVVVQKGVFKQGDKVVYFLPDTVLPLEISDQLGVTKYLSKQRVRTVRLRGEPSFGFVVPAGPDDFIGDDVSLRYGATKYEPPATKVEDAEPEDSFFPRYTEVEHLRQYPNVIPTKSLVYVTEKIHGTNSRVGLVGGEMYAGSHGIRRKRPADLSQSLYWYPWTLKSVNNLMFALARECGQVVLYGEIYGMQKGFKYDAQNQGYRAFDLMIEGKYVAPGEFIDYMEVFEVPYVPVLDVLEYDFESIKSLAEGQSTMGSHIREGVVVKPADEMFDPKIGRVVLKYLSSSYMVKADENRTKGVSEIAH